MLTAILHIVVDTFEKHNLIIFRMVGNKFEFVWNVCLTSDPSFLFAKK